MFFTNFSYQTKLTPQFKNSKIYPYDQIVEALNEIVTNYLEGYQLVIMTKESFETKELFNNLISKLFQSEKLIYSFYIPGEDLFLDLEEEDKNFLPEFIQRSTCICLLLVNDEALWLEESQINFGFFTTLVVSLNSKINPETLLASPILQRSQYLSLIEFSQQRNENKTLVYSSFPYSYTNGKQNFSTFLGEYSEKTFGSKESLFPERFTNLNGEVLYIASDKDDYPLIYVDEDGEVDGTNIRIVKTIGNYLNYTFALTKQAPDGYWGEKVNDTWNGLLGMVEQGGYNFTINYFALVLDRSKEFDFTAFYFFEGFGFALRLPPPLPAWLSLVHPFSWQVWVSVTTFILFISLILYSLHRWIPWVQDSNPLLKVHLYILQVKE